MKSRQIRDMMHVLCGAGLAGAIISLAQGDYKTTIVVALLTVVVGGVLWMEG